MALCLCRDAGGFGQYPFIKPVISSLLLIVKLLNFRLKPRVLNTGLSVRCRVPSAYKTVSTTHEFAESEENSSVLFPSKL